MNCPPPIIAAVCPSESQLAVADAFVNHPDLLAGMVYERPLGVSLGVKVDREIELGVAGIHVRGSAIFQVLLSDGFCLFFFFFLSFSP